MENLFVREYNIITEIICWIDRLADNCHMPELTNHALPHICSIVKRASEWGESDGWLEETTYQEAGYLLMEKQSFHSVLLVAVG